MRKLLLLVALSAATAFSQTALLDVSHGIDLRYYGAVCDGTNVNTAVLDAIADGHTSLYLPAGCVWIPSVGDSGFNQIQPANLEVYGENSTSIIKSPTPATDPLYWSAGVKLHHLSINSSSYPQTFVEFAYSAATQAAGWTAIIGTSGNPATAPYNTGDATLAGFYAGSASAAHSGGTNVVESFLNMDSTWTTHGKPYAAFRADVIASPGSTASPVGLFISASSNSANSEVYGIWSTVASSTGSAGSFTHGLLNGYLEARDYISTTTAVTNMAALELNINTHSGPSDVYYGHLGVNLSRQCQAPCIAAGDIMSGSAIQAGGAGNAHADWAGFLRFLQGYDAAYILHVDNQNPGGVLGMWRMYNANGLLSFRTNTAVARDFSTFTTPFAFDGSALYVGGVGGGAGDAITAYFGANNGLIVLGGGAGDAISVKTTIPGAAPLGMPGIKATSGTRFLCIDSTGVVSSSASACSGA